MKKSLLALAVAATAFAASTVSAANVYDKDGTKLDVNARIEIQWHNATQGNNSSSDSTINNWTRFGVAGSSKLSDYATAYGAAEWDMTDGDARQNSTDKGVGARDQLVGVDFGAFGKVQSGRYKQLINKVVGVTDVLVGDGYSAKSYVVGDGRQAGKLTYMWSGYGFEAGAEYQSAKDGYTDSVVKNTNIESGYSLMAGYTTPAVVFGPIGVKAGYSYLDVQDDAGYARTFDNAKSFAVSAFWGNAGSGLYLATEYSRTTLAAVEAADEDYKATSYEFVTKYSFDNGFIVSAAYQNKKYDDGAVTYVESQLPICFEYVFNPNFKVYSMFAFGLKDTNDEADGKSAKVMGPTYGDKNTVCIGGRYTF